MKSVIIFCLVAPAFALGALTTTGATAADCKRVETTRVVNGLLQVVVEMRCSEEASPDNQTVSDGGPGGSPDPRVGQGLCIVRAQLAGVDPATMCAATGPEPAPTLTPAMVARALRNVSLPSSRLQVQPPNGRTLVNFDTNFYTERTPFTRAVTLLGRRVELRIEPVRFTWHFGDGAPRTTASPGAPYPDLDVTHDYARAGRYAPRVDTTYGADWRVAGGAWQRVPGTVTITGDAVALEATEARPTLVR